MDLIQDVDIVSGRIDELLTQARENARQPSEQDLLHAVSTLRKGVDTKRIELCRAALQELRVAIKLLRAKNEIWKEIRENIRLRQGLIASICKWQHDHGQAIPVQQVLEVLLLILGFVKDEVADPQVWRAIRSRLEDAVAAAKGNRRPAVPGKVSGP